MKKTKKLYNKQSLNILSTLMSAMGYTKKDTAKFIKKHKLKKIRIYE